ncbi:exo-beta-N-acetylmuramidase NamZ domain-containing protein [Psychroserpens sp. XS_ASV72]|uniref:exo-beta-N-acetylmuramidase NamZ family protein n=1 Tax=Psychroserpens sp. XS_ASV72 TaxID=3241293 RepID=UPI0035110462
MFKNTVLFPIVVGIVLLISCGNERKHGDTTPKDNSTYIDETLKQVQGDANIIVGANRTSAYVPLLKNKNIGIVANQTSVILNTDGYTHLVDSLLALDISIKKVFAPEHGFRGMADAGEMVKDGVDSKTNLPIVSLYGSNKKPSKAQLTDLDLIIFDIQDVGARFYTYISTLHYVMEACAESNIPLIVFDRPNPNGHYIDGPILEMEHQSFVGMHPIPVVHGMTIGEYAKMINGEAWLKDGVQCNLTIIEMEHYAHNKSYSLPIKPSPNLPNDIAINLYPSLCFFEGTNVSAGRGTSGQFQVYGSPFLDKDKYAFKFIPQPNEGAKYPKHKGELCYGEDLRDTKPFKAIHLDYLINAYKNSVGKQPFFNDFFVKLAGTKQLQTQIESGLSSEDIKQSWEAGLSEFKDRRATYLIYD